MFEFVQNNKVFIQVVLGAVALTFVGFGVGSYEAASDDPYLAKVGSAKIYKRDLDRALEGQPTDLASRQAALENLIRQELLLSDAHDRGVSVSPEQLRKVIASIPAFQDNGKFSPERYREFLQNRYPSPEAFEAQVKRDIVLQGQLTGIAGTEFVAGTVVNRLAGLLGEGREVRSLLLKPADFAAEVKTDDAALKAFYDANLKRFRVPERVKLDYVLLSQDALAQGLKPSDAELQKYYEQHKAEFSNEQRRASHILLTVAKDAKPEQKAKVKAEAEALLKEVRANPARFAELAKSKSQDPGSAANGGDLGFFGHGMMVKPFDDAVFRMKPGQISEVIETEFGYHIIKLDEVKAQDFAEVKAAIADKLQRQQAGGLFRSQADKLTELAYQQGDSLKALQEQLKLQPQHSDWLSRGKPAADPLLNSPKVLEAAFSEDVLKKKHNSEPVDIGNNRLLVVRVAEHQPERQQTLDEVRDVIKTELVAKEGAKLAEKKGQALLAELKAGKGEGKAWSEAKTLLRRDPAGLPIADARAVFAAQSGKLPAFAGAKRDNGDYALYRIDKVIPAPAASEAERGQLSAILGEMNANAQLSSYLDTLRQKYSVTMGKQGLSDAQ
ncbi:SurA N-terminal domain-containing protein [Chromobacterium alkanivorans]|uniref:SurA N-terminal domain-containing protein n=1 Tax=Chromobacterium alkanivorans TaxID=1071719 RepID=UPI0019678CCB|nr:SurA N-terminal domain-containing protein [Chromobacterium alkanivorans]MBN3004255.1 SurA N-terminal domain-containing protein [Chromobacterium alkanivorans]